LARLVIELHGIARDHIVRVRKHYIGLKEIGLGVRIIISLLGHKLIFRIHDFSATQVIAIVFITDKVQRISGHRRPLIIHDHVATDLHQGSVAIVIHLIGSHGGILINHPHMAKRIE